MSMITFILLAAAAFVSASTLAITMDKLAEGKK